MQEGKIGEDKKSDTKRILEENNAEERVKGKKRHLTCNPHPCKKNQSGPQRECLRKGGGETKREGIARGDLNSRGEEARAKKMQTCEIENLLPLGIA